MNLPSTIALILLLISLVGCATEVAPGDTESKAAADYGNRITTTVPFECQSDSVSVMVADQRHSVVRDGIFGAWAGPDDRIEVICSGNRVAVGTCAWETNHVVIDFSEHPRGHVYCNRGNFADGYTHIGYRRTNPLDIAATCSSFLGTYDHGEKAWDWDGSTEQCCNGEWKPDGSC